jgi:hypothetical protein
MNPAGNWKLTIITVDKPIQIHQKTSAKPHRLLSKARTRRDEDMYRPVFRLLMYAPNEIQNNQIASEILLVDPKTEIRDAQVQDLSDATYHGNTSTRVRAAEHKEAGQCDVIVVTAGAAQKEGTSHLIQFRYPEYHCDRSLVLVRILINHVNTDMLFNRRIPHRPHRPQPVHPVQRDRRHEAHQGDCDSLARRQPGRRPDLFRALILWLAGEASHW